MSHNSPVPCLTAIGLALLMATNVGALDYIPDDFGPAYETTEPWEHEWTAEPPPQDDDNSIFPPFPLDTIECPPPPGQVGGTSRGGGETNVIVDPQAVGHPVAYATGNVFLRERDFAVRTKNGTVLALDRFHSSGFISTFNSMSHNSMFGAGTFSPYEARIVLEDGASESTEAGGLEWGFRARMLGMDGNWVIFKQLSATEFQSFLGQGNLIEMTMDPLSTSARYTVDFSDHRRLVFNSLGNLVSIERDTRTAIDDSITIAWEGPCDNVEGQCSERHSTRIKTIAAPEDDGRYLEFEYEYSLLHASTHPVQWRKPAVVYLGIDDGDSDPENDVLHPIVWYSYTHGGIATLDVKKYSDGVHYTKRFLTDIVNYKVTNATPSITYEIPVPVLKEVLWRPDSGESFIPLVRYQYGTYAVSMWPAPSGNGTGFIQPWNGSYPRGDTEARALKIEYAKFNGTSYVYETALSFKYSARINKERRYTEVYFGDHTVEEDLPMMKIHADRDSRITGYEYHDLTEPDSIAGLRYHYEPPSTGDPRDAVRNSIETHWVFGALDFVDPEEEDRRLISRTSYQQSGWNGGLPLEIDYFRELDSMDEEVLETITMSYHEDFRRVIETITNAEGESVHYTYYDEGTAGSNPLYGLLESVTTPTRTVYFEYYESWTNQRLLKRIESDWSRDQELDQFTEFEYTERGLVSSITYPDGDEVSLTWNDFNQVTSVERPGVGMVVYTYSDAEEYASDSSTIPSAQLAIPPRLLETLYPDGGIKRYLYRTDGRVETVAVRNNNTTGDLWNETNFEYDGFGRLSGIEHADGGSVILGYNLYSQVVSYEDQEGNLTTYVHDEFGRVVEVVHPEETSTFYTYGGASCGSCGNGAGQVRMIQRPVKPGEDDQFVHLTYDGRGRVVGVEYSDSDTPTGTPQVEYRYDFVGRVVEVIDDRLPFTSKSYEFAYDTGETGLLESITHPDGYRQQLFYGDFNLLSAYKDPDGRVTRFSRDALGRLAEMAVLDQGDPYSWAYEAASVSPDAPIGSLVAMALSNGSTREFGYDSSGRLDSLVYKDSNAAVYESLGLDFGSAGEILRRTRVSDGTTIKNEFAYDAVYRLLKEETRDESDVSKWKREYEYDLVGNREVMQFFGGPWSYESMVSGYGESNQLDWTFGSINTPSGEVYATEYEYDGRGNTTQRAVNPGPDETLWEMEWNVDDRLTKATRKIYGESSLLSTLQVSYSYDSAGRRILTKEPARLVRHYFNGLTEEIRKQSANWFYWEDPLSFERVTAVDPEDPPSGWPTLWDEDLLEEVFEVEQTTLAWEALAEGGKRTFATWLKSPTTSGRLELRVEGMFSIGSFMGPMSFPPPFMDEITIVYNPASTSRTWSGSTLTIGVDGTAADFDRQDGDDNPMWTRLERDWMADAALAPGFEPSQVTAVRLRHTPSGDPMLGGAISFSNSITIEENTLGPGVVGHLLHARTISPVTFAAVDRWFAYDQVGSVLAETDADGELAATHHADAWGNRLEDWDTGVWGGLRVGWAHNTKEIDGLTDLTYMYKRWYAPETGTFLSRAPYEPMIEHEYGFAAGNPVSLVDPDGRIITYGGDESERRILENSVDTLERTDPRFKMFIDNLKQSEAETHIMPTDGRSGASDQGPLRNVIWINIMDRCENRPLIVTLGHELVHAHDYILGIINRNVSPNSPPDRPWTVAEDRATAWENLLRTRLGLPTRANYGDNGLGNQVGAGAARPVPRIQ